MSDEIIRTAFDRVQRELGGELVDWEGWYWPNHFGDPVAEHHAIRTDVGVWDASPLRKWDVHRARTRSRRPTGSSRTTCSGSRSARSATRRSATRTGRWSATARSSRSRTTTASVVTALDSDLDHFHDGRRRAWTWRSSRARRRLPQLGSTARARASCSQSLTDADVSSLRYFRFWPEQVNVGGVPVLGLPHRLLRRARLRALLLARRAPSSSGPPSRAPARGRTGSPPSRRSGSSRG